MKGALWTTPKQKGQDSEGREEGFWKRKSGIHGQQPRAGSFEQPGLFTVLFPGDLRVPCLGETMEMATLLGCHSSCFMGK